MPQPQPSRVQRPVIRDEDVTQLQEIPGNVPSYMPGSIAVLEDRYSEVVVNVMDLVLKWQLFSLM